MISNTILVRHMPSDLTHEEKSELLQHFGAIDVKILGQKTKKSNLIYARFESGLAAEVAVQKLHQINVLGQRISVELARGPVHETIVDVDTSVLNVTDEKQDRILRAREAFLKKLGLSIKDYNFSQPPPLNLYYQYPPPTRLILDNISKAMANIPKFYNQVLHLMNKMNIPCPFTDNYPLESDLYQETQLDESVTEEVRLEKEQTNKDSSEGESEIGSDTENKVHSHETELLKRKKVQKKVIKRPKFVKPQVFVATTSKVGLKPDDVFEKPKETVQKKIELKITSNLSSILEAQDIQAVESTQEGFEVIKAPQKVQEKMVDSVTMVESSEDSSPTFITAEQLAANQVSVKDQRVLPVFKNYQAGAPSCRLYIKNLAKQVQSRDLHFIYRRFYRRELDQEQGSMFDIRLMQEGRMKGQAFVTLQNVELAQTALKATNGYILKDKPMVVQFARSAATK